MTVAGVASAISTGAIGVALSDDADPWWRGQKETEPASGELTIAETVQAAFTYPDGAPQAGSPYPVDVKWKYQRTTTDRTYTHSVGERQKNIHVSDGVEVEVPSDHNAFAGPLVVKAKFYRENGNLFTGQDLYSFALLRVRGFV